MTGIKLYGHEREDNRVVLKVTDDVARVMFNLGRRVYIRKQSRQEALDVLCKEAVKAVTEMPASGTAVYVDA